MADTLARPRPRGELIDIGGRRLHVVRAGPRGSDRPLVMLEAGAFGFSADWAAVQSRLAARGWESLAYDRAGLGLSDIGPGPRDGAAVGADAEALLTRLAPDRKMILVGHSMAGLHVHRLATRLPDRIVGLVLVDATTPQSMNSRFVAAAVAQFNRLSRLAAWGAGVGLLRPLAGTPLGDRIGLASEIADEKRWAFADADHNAAAAAEVAEWPAAARQAQEAGDLDANLPVAVVLAGASGPQAGLRALQAAPANASRRGLVECVAGANHATILSEPYADAVVRAIEHVARDARAPEANSGGFTRRSDGPV